jgi:hypothetical protein
MTRKDRQERQAARKAAIEGSVRFATLGIAVKDGEVVEMKLLGDVIRRLGPLAGASAEVTAGTPGYSTRLARVTAFVKFADGTFLERKLVGGPRVRNAQAGCVRFNLLAATSKQ